MSGSINWEFLPKLNTFSGIRYPLPENYGKWGKLQKITWNVYADFIHALFVIEILSLVIKISLFPNDLGIFCACFVGAGYALNLNLKLCIFRRNEKLFGKLFRDIREISGELCSNPFDGGYKQFFDSTYNKIVRTSVIKGGIEVTATILLILIFIVRSCVYGVPESLITPALTWTPYDNSKNPVYSLTCFFELVVYGSITLRNAAIDLLFWLMLIVPTIQLRYLDGLLKIIMNEKRESVKDLKSEFVWWIRYHQRVLSMIQEFKTISSPYLGVNYLTTLLLLTLAGLVAISTTSWDMFQRAIINGIVISNTIQLYFVSLAGDWLAESSENAAEGGFSIALLSADNSIQKDYLFVCARSKRSLQIRFGGINRLCSENFEQLIRMTITYLVTIVQLRTEE